MCQFINHNNVYGSKVVTHTMKKKVEAWWPPAIKVNVSKIYIEN